ncbi:Myosin type-2 heavy chain 1 [Pseudocercospora fuligena]|uniref:Myosin type-2 heavy chain 1 n=1 Tax=Pseudocercospora fuligena TaxID=685502 RepID=A0A8H6VMK6_9PEZI|nr:Myosin type-2 heavy chain 1 [Pseudocercospora fuligena]
MSSQAQNGPRWRNSPFGQRDNDTPSPGPPPGHARSKSSIMQNPLSSPTPIGHARQQSITDFGLDGLGRPDQRRVRAGSVRNSTPAGTFAPKFIKHEDPAAAEERVRGIEGENDFSGKRYVWLRDPSTAFVRGWVVEELPDNMLKVQCDDGSQRDVPADSVDKVNPAKFDKADDMAELTHLNEPSVVHNLQQRYQADLIYTYSGLFLVTVNPYTPLPIYGRDYVNMYKGRSREDTRPHIFAMADEAFRNLLDEGTNQSILVTGESGAGKTENTKKVIQYLAAVATSDTPRAKSGGRQLSNLSEQILRANPILEAFGNAQTVRNNNSSRFGKFIRIQFGRAGQIAGAYIDWYLLEKSRVVRLNSHERNYHVFYQLLRGASQSMRREFMVDGKDVEDFEYTRHGNDMISGVSDQEEWNSLLEAFHIMNFSDQEQKEILQTIAAVLHLGNITVMKESLRADQAALSPEAAKSVACACKLLGISQEPFVKALLHPRVRAGHEWVEKVQTPEQVRLAIDALAKGIYERGFGNLVDRINKQLDRTSSGAYDDDTSFIGVLDIAGFEIFEENSFEQLCINYTNEKLQQFFNHHMFVLEQEEYAREQIEWKFIDFGRDLQPTIDLIEVTNPIGIFSCLDEDSVMPKATDKSFTEKLHSLWDRKTPKYKRSLLNQGFMLTHYAAEVEYSTEGWLEKNKDPLNDNVTRLLGHSTNGHIAHLFADCAEFDEGDGAARSRVKKGLFRTVAQRHKEQLSTLMAQLHSTHPHFVRCILPNHKKKPKQFNSSLVLDQLRCNGVLEGIRIARTGFPNRLLFAEFRARYEVLCQNMPKGYIEGQAYCKIMLEKLNMDRSWYRVGLTKVFFRAGVLAELEEKRDALIRDIVVRFQAVARMYVQRRIFRKQQYRAEATRVIQRNFQVYLQLQQNPWWQLFVRMRPLLGATRQSNEVKKREEEIKLLHAKMAEEEAQRAKVEDERRRAEAEIQKVQKTLESERALALDKEEIFRRLQNRETELTEKLQGALEDQDHLEGQIDELIAARKIAEEQAEERLNQLEQAGQIIDKLETEKGDLVDRIAELDAHLEEVEKSKSMRSEQEEALQQEIRMLQSQLSLRERKLQDLEAKLLKNDQDLDLKLSTATKDLQNARKQVKDLVEENRSIRQQMSDLSSTSTSFEDLIKRKDSELAILKTDLKRFQDDRKRFEDEKHGLTTKHDSIQNRLRDTLAEMEVLRSQHGQLQREATDAKRALEDQTSANEQVEMLEAQLHDVKGELYQAQADLSREQQSRDDVKRIAAAEYEGLKREYDSLHESKVTVEKEMYSQSDLTRRATAAREAAEKERKDYQAELQTLRKKFIQLQEEKLEVEAAVERDVSQKANERHAIVRKELDEKTAHNQELESERSQLSGEVQRLKRFIADSENFKLHHDQEKQRLERELVTTKGRLTASENDNKALMNKIQMKSLDIARSNSKASDTQRGKIAQLQMEKTKADDEVKKLHRQLNDAQLTITSLEKQKEKLALSLEDLNHEVEREHKTTRNAEQQYSAAGLQLAEANRKLETERTMRSQAQQNSKTLQNSLDTAHKEITEAHEHLRLLQKIFDPESGKLPQVDGAKPDLKQTIDLAHKLEASEQALHLATERFARAESQLEQLRAQHSEDMQENENRYQNSKRALLEEMNPSQVNARSSPGPGPLRREWDNRKTWSPANNSATHTPTSQRHISKASQDSAQSDRSTDTLTLNSRMDLAAEVEELQTQLQMSEMQNRHLQAQLGRGSMKNDWSEESPSMRRVQKLERENFRLHDMLDDSAKKVSSLEQSIRAGQLSLKEVQTKSHEELYDLINSQEQSRRSLLTSHNAAIAELADAKTSFDEIKHYKAGVEVELRDAKSELADLQYEREQEAANHSQLLQEFSDLQIRLDAETSRSDDLMSSMNLYKARADEYFEKLEQAEIAVLKASRAEQFAKSQAKEVEEQCATILSERKQMDDLVEDLQRQVQQYEEKVEDVSSDLDSAMQAKKRLQNELEDYRSQRAKDIEDKESSMEQTRRKYQAELATLNNELELERDNVIHARGENGRLRDELEELRNKWDDEVLNSSTWAKEKSRLEIALQGLSDSRDEAVSAHNEAQSKIVELLGQVRGLRTNIDDTAAERDMLVKEKKGLEARLAEAAERLNDLANDGSPSKRSAASSDREVLDLKAKLAQQEDIAAAAVGKMRRAEALAQEVSRDIANERESSVQLHREKAALEKSAKELQLKCIELETKGYSSGSQDVRYLHGRIQELESQLEDLEKTRTTEARSVRSVDRTVKDLQSQIERREKSMSMLQDDLNRSRDKIGSLLQTIDELQQSDSTAQLASKRAERELLQEREKNLRLEREIERMGAVSRADRESVRRSGTLAALSDSGMMDRSRRGSSVAPSTNGGEVKIDVPQRKSSLIRNFL